MADLRIEKKEKSSSILPWLLGLLVLGLAVWGIAELVSEDPIEGLAETEIIEDADARGSEIVSHDNTYTLIDFDDPAAGDRFDDLYTEYETYTASMTGEMGLDHEFSHNALNQLANTTMALASAHGMQADLNVKKQVQMIKQKAEDITKDPMATTHADDIKTAGMAISSILSQIQKAHYPGLDDATAEVVTAAENIDRSTLTLDQKKDVRTFFGSARVLLKGMKDLQG